MSNCLNDKRGMSLLEVIIAMSIFVLLIGSITELMIFAFRSTDNVWEQLSTQNESRLVLQEFTGDVRRATYSSVGAYPLEVVDEQELVFFANIDEDTWRERVRYFLEDGTFKKGVTKPSGEPLGYDLLNEVVTEIAHDIINDTNPVFYYYGQNYDGSGDPLVQPVGAGFVRIIKIDLILEEDPRASPVPLHVEGKAEIRNLKNN